MQMQADIYGFYISENLNPYILYTSRGSGVPSMSQYSSLNNVEAVSSLLQLAPVAPVSATPMVAAVSENQQFVYSTWQPENLGLINLADGFMDWKALDLGGEVMKVGIGR